MAPHESRFTNKEKEEIQQIVFAAMDDYFSNKGKMSKNLLLTAAMVIGSITVIFGGAKALLGWLGFSYLNK